MNKKERIMKRNILKKKYKARGSMMPPRENVIYISKNNSIKHEWFKCLIAIMIRKGYTTEQIKKLKNIDKIQIELNEEPIEKEGHFITEACIDDRIVDVVNLTGEEIEIVASNLSKKSRADVVVRI